MNSFKFLVKFVAMSATSLEMLDLRLLRAERSGTMRDAVVGVLKVPRSFESSRCQDPSSRQGAKILRVVKEPYCLGVVTFLTGVYNGNVLETNDSKDKGGLE